MKDKEIQALETRPFRKRIYITLGPASSKGERLQQLLHSGIHGVRINMSHANHDELPSLLQTIRYLAPGIEIAADLRGRKIRIGPLANGKIELKVSNKFTMVPSEKEIMGSESMASVNYPNLTEKLEKGTIILLDDGALTLRICEIEAEAITCNVERGGTLPERSGVNLPGQKLGIPALMDKDYKDLDFLRQYCPDQIYLSFTETIADLELLRGALKERHMKSKIISKVETLVAVHHFRELLDNSDAVCIARGDLGVEIPYYKMPFTQRALVEAAKKTNKVVLLAGELLYSLIKRHTPFRAELTDIITAVEQGVSGFVLSDETAIGIDPINAVEVLQSLIVEAETELKNS